MTQAMLKPPGFATVTPYMFADGAEALIEFLTAGLGGTEDNRTLRDDGKVANSQVRFGDCTVMVSEASAAFPAMPASYYLYVADADAAMEQAIAAGAVEIMAVGDMPYDDRQGGVRDPCGNIWWISQRLVERGYD